MNTTGNTLLITGGGSGIGLETAKLFAREGNRVIIAGRNKYKLEDAAKQIGNAEYISFDLKSEEQIDELVETITNRFGTLNVLMNNAGEAYAYRLSATANAYEKAKAEIITNYLSGVLLTEKLLPVLQQQPEAAIINVSSIVAFSPSGILPSYSASKAALHSYTQILRLTLSQSNIKVFEVMPPLVDTEFAKEIQSDSKISPLAVAEDIFDGFKNNRYEIRVASTEDFYKLYMSSPEQALLAMNRM